MLNSEIGKGSVEVLFFCFPLQGHEQNLRFRSAFKFQKQNSNNKDTLVQFRSPYFFDVIQRPVNGKPTDHKFELQEAGREKQKNTQGIYIYINYISQHIYIYIYMYIYIHMETPRLKITEEAMI